MIVTRISKPAQHERYALGSPTVVWKTDEAYKDVLEALVSSPTQGRSWQPLSAPFNVANNLFDCAADGAVAIGGEGNDPLNNDFSLFQPSLGSKLPESSQNWHSIALKEHQATGSVSVASGKALATVLAAETQKFPAVRYGAGCWADIAQPEGDFTPTEVALGANGDALLAAQRMVDGKLEANLYYVYATALPIKIGSLGPYKSLNLLEDGKVLCVDGAGALTTYFGEGRWHTITPATLTVGPHGKLIPKPIQGAIEWVTAISLRQLYLSISGHGIYVPAAETNVGLKTQSEEEESDMEEATPEPATAQALSSQLAVNLDAVRKLL